LVKILRDVQVVQRTATSANLLRIASSGVSLFSSVATTSPKTFATLFATRGSHSQTSRSQQHDRYHHRNSK
jgi:hypothetical protein